MLTLKIDNRVTLFPLEALAHQRLVEQIAQRLTFKNPRFAENEKRGFSNWGTPEYIHGYELAGDRLIVPRGFYRKLIRILKNAGVHYQIDDRRRTLPEVEFQFLGELLDFQVEAVEAMAARDFGVLEAPTGAGKTVVALALVASRRQPALVVVQSKDLVKQWIERIEEFLGIPAREVGMIAGGNIAVCDRITVALMQTLDICAGGVAPHFGFLVVDECNGTPSRTFTEAVKAFDSRFMLGLSATPRRRAGISRLIYWYVGDKVHEIDKAALVEAGHVLRAEVITGETDFKPTQDPARNALIASDVAQEAHGNAPGECLPSTSIWINPKAPAWLSQLIFGVIAGAMESPESSMPQVDREISARDDDEEGSGPGL